MRITSEQAEIISNIISSILSIDPETDYDDRMLLRSSMCLIGMLDGFMTENAIYDSNNKVTEKQDLEDFSLNDSEDFR